jgi:hypothetical protein
MPLALARLSGPLKVNYLRHSSQQSVITSITYETSWRGLLIRRSQVRALVGEPQNQSVNCAESDGLWVIFYYRYFAHCGAADRFIKHIERGAGRTSDADGAHVAEAKRRADPENNRSAIGILTVAAGRRLVNSDREVVISRAATRYLVR